MKIAWDWESIEPAPLETVINIPHSSSCDHQCLLSKQDAGIQPDSDRLHSPSIVLYSVSTMCHCECADTCNTDTHISYDSDKHASIHLYEAELSPAESIADGGEGGYSQQEVQAKSQNPH